MEEKKEEKKEEKEGKKKEKDKKGDEENSKMLSCDTIVGNIIMISPVPKVYKKLVKISKDREKDLSTLVEDIVEEYVKFQSFQ